ncbi:MAG: Nitrilotriacetate monooxygenase component B [uncultured Solirubrobacteraceae bacterium]|uniref:Nitrilotriacetate monooxygenase component B n=1 Tax=uncultured Solirubrobacteraceae bacterium TaxID=1162706 RepID=A0A6J4RL90_9ACTN|nr:MAG: Nitrilotriacetate monooxygenase component B [uncultured Solirubrobacteraceae bacterium]
MTVEQRRFRDVVGTFPTGVTVVTAPGPAGLTTNAFTSVSLEPPLVLVCFDNTSRTLPAVRECRRFAVNVLRAGQEELATLFASKAVAEEKFASVTHTVEHGVPVLDDALAWMACEVVDLVDAGDHTIGIGRVNALEASEGEPLLFVRGAYRTVAD